MKIILMSALVLVSSVSFSQMSMKNMHRGTFPTQQQQYNSETRPPNTIDGLGNYAIRYVPVVVDGQIIYVPENKTLLVPSNPPPAYNQTTISQPSGPSVRIERSFSDNASPRVKNWPRVALGVDKVENVLSGRGVTVAVFDSGVNAHEQFAAGSVDIFDVTGKENASDIFGHGTSITGIIVGSGQGESGFRSVAPGVKVQSYKISDNAGMTNNFHIEHAVEYVLDYNKTYPGSPITIINLSYGLDVNNDTLKAALKRAYDSGITIVASAGNSAAPALVYPAAYDFVVAVGAINHRKQILDTSNYGVGLDFMAPGSGIFVPYNDGGYGWVRGTSVATAYITGVAALVAEAYQNKYGKKPSPQEVYTILKKISVPLAEVPANKQGFGLPDASKISSVI